MPGSMSAPRAPVRAARVLVALAALLVPALADRAAAGPLGPPGDELISDGIRRQDRRLRDVSIDAVVTDQQNLANRPSVGETRIARLYLLARAYGKRLDPARRDLANSRQVYGEVLGLAPNCYFAHRDLGMLALK